MTLETFSIFATGVIFGATIMGIAIFHVVKRLMAVTPNEVQK